jgi:carbamoyl-phosphate synthase large subunit
MNVLLTTAGRRTTLLRRLREAAASRGGKVVACDADRLAPALFLADAAETVPVVQSPDYLARLLEIVRKHDIRMIVPTIDPELPFLAAHAAKIRETGAEPLVSQTGLLDVTGDKWNTAQHFESCGLDVPRSWLPDDLPPQDELPEQLFVKPRDGSASLHTYAVTRDQLAECLPRVPNAIVQEQLEGPEVTVDALLDLEGTPIHYVPRRRIRTLAGESIQGVTLDDTPFRAFLVHALQAVGDLGGRGPMTLQFFDTTRGPVLTEINPRFGGGFPLGDAAGGHYTEWILDLLVGKVVPPRIGEYVRDRYMTRYNTEHFVDAVDL